MRVVNIEISSDDDEDKGTVTLIRESNRLGTWTRDSSEEVTVGDDNASQEIRLRPDQRIIIEGRAAPEMVFDRGQFASVNPTTQEDPSNPVPGEPSKEIPHPDNNDAIAQEAERLAAAAEVNKQPVPEYPEPAPTEKMVERTVRDPRPPAPAPRKEQVEVRTPTTGVTPKNMAKPEQNKTDLTTTKTPEQADRGAQSNK